MEVVIVTKCPDPECGFGNLVSILDRNQGPVGFYSDDPKFTFVPARYVPQPANIVQCCVSCSKDFVVGIILEAHVTTRKIAETEGGES